MEPEVFQKSKSSCPLDSGVLILIVDDESSIGEVAERILKNHGFRTRLFCDPNQAIQHVTSGEEKPELVLTDFMMPGVNGLELIARCRRILPNIKVVLYTGYGGEEITQFCSVRIDGFLRKPFLPDDLVAAVNSALAAE